MQIGKDIERYDWYYDPELFTEVIIDRLKSEQYRNSTKICELLNQQHQQIAELEEQLKGCIRPKFKIGQTSYYIFNDVVGIFKPEKVCEVRDILILGIQFYGQEIQYQTTYGLFNENNLFPTKEEAEEKLKELQGE